MSKGSRGAEGQVPCSDPRSRHTAGHPYNSCACVIPCDEQRWKVKHFSKLEPKIWAENHVNIHAGLL